MSNFFKNLSLNIVVGIITPILFVATMAFAAPPASPYSSGETLNPSCAPGDANCTVLITVTSATSGFTVSGGNLVAPTILGGTSTTQDLTFQTTNGVGATGADMHFLVGNNGATEAMTILNSGNIGIGTTTPIAKLEIEGSVLSQELARFEVSSTQTGIANDYGTLSLVNTDTTNNNYSTISFLDNDAGIFSAAIYGIYTDHTNNYGDISFATNSASGWTQKMHILSSGNVGIGTITPGSRLVVKGEGSTSATSALNITSSANTSMLFVRNDGIVGIGTTAPVSKLSVSGNVAIGAGYASTGAPTNGLLVEGNIGIGTTDMEAWDANRVNLQLGNNFALSSHKTSNQGTFLLSNAYYNGSSFIYRETDEASNLTMDPSGDFWFRVASSNTAGQSISWITAMSIDNTTLANTIVTDSVGVGIGGAPSTKLHIASSDLGDGVAGPIITLGRNTNATNTGAGSINFLSKAATAGYVWQDAAGKLRIHTSAPSNANDTAGTVVGDQTSIRETKQDIEDYGDYNSALNMVLDAPLHTFRYRKEVIGYGSDSPLAKIRLGYIADEVDPLFMNGNSIDQVSVNGILLASVKALNLKIEQMGTGAVVNETSNSYLQNFLSDVANGLTNLYAKIIHGERGVFKNEICLGEEGNKTCITKAELDALLESASISPASPEEEIVEEPTPLDEVEDEAVEEIVEEEIEEETVEETEEPSEEPTPVEEIEEAVEE